MVECSDDERKHKIIALIIVKRLVDSESSGINSCEAQCERAIWSTKRARQNRNTQSIELAKRVKKCGATDVIMTECFNEIVCSTNMQNFMTETGLCDVFQEINGVEPNQIEATHEHGSKCMYYVLST